MDSWIKLCMFTSGETKILYFLRKREVVASPRKLYTKKMVNLRIGCLSNWTFLARKKVTANIGLSVIGSGLVYLDFLIFRNSDFFSPQCFCNSSYTKQKKQKIP